MARKPPITEGDRALFRAAMAGVRPLASARVEPRRRRPSPYPRQTRRDQVAVLGELLDGDYDVAELETGEELCYARPGLQHRLLRKLRRGRFAAGAELDLHGMTVPVAREQLARFLALCRTRDIRCVRIIHGKGRGSRNGGPVLKCKVNTWLRRRDDVLAFCSAQAADGGTGAVYVLLRRP